MEPGSPEWIEKTVEELEYLETARESLANAPVGNGIVPTEGARQAQLAAFDHRIATLFAELEPFAGDEEEESSDAGDPLPALSTALPVAGGSTSTQPAVTTPEANAFDDDPFAAPSFSAPAVAPPGAPSFDQGPAFDDSAAFGSGLGSDYGDDLNEGAPKKKKWVLPAVLGAVGVAACAVVIPMLGSSDAPQADPTLSQPAAAAIAPAATPTPVPEPEPEPEPVVPAEQAAAADPAANAGDAGTQVAANTENAEQPAAQESDLEDWENPAVLKMRSPRGRKARRKAKMMKKREARRRRREAAAERREAAAERRRNARADGGGKKGKKRRSKRRKPREESSASADEPAPKKRKRKRLDLDNSGDPLG